MTTILEDISRTFREFLILPGLTKKDDVPSKVSLAAPLARCKNPQDSAAMLNIPFVSAAMQAVSGPALSISLARKGGCSFIYCSQPIEMQAEMVRQVKDHKAGRVLGNHGRTTWAGALPKSFPPMKHPESAL